MKKILLLSFFSTSLFYTANAQFKARYLDDGLEISNAEQDNYSAYYRITGCADGSALVATTLINGIATGHQVKLTKTNTDLEASWTKIISVTPGLFFDGMTEISGGGCFLFFTDNPSGWSSTFTCQVVKLDADANITWARSYTLPFYSSYSKNHIKATSTGEAILIFSQYNGINYLWLDAGGNIVRGEEIKSDCWQSKNPGFDGALINDSTIVFSAKSGSDNYFATLTRSGNVLWSSIIADGTYNRPYAVLKRANGEIMAAGLGSTGTSTAYLMKLGVNGNIIWKKNYSGISAFGEMTEDKNGNFILHEMDGKQIVVVDANGSFVSSYAFAGYKPAIDFNSDYYFTIGYMNFAKGKSRPFLMRSEIGDFSNCALEEGAAVNISNGPGNATITSGSMCRTTIGTDNGAFSATSATDSYSYKTLEGCLPEYAEPDFTLTVFPNPTENAITCKIEGLGIDQPFTYEVFSHDGKLLRSGQTNYDPLSSLVSVVEFAPGIYSIRIKTDGVLVGVSKFIVTR